MEKHLVTIFLIGVVCSSYAQSHTFGLFTGINFSNVSAKEVFDEEKYRQSYVGGIKYDFNISDKYQLGTDLIYSLQGFVSEVNFTDETGNPTGQKGIYEFTYDYLTLPLKVGLIIGDKVKIVPKIGIQPSLLASAKTKEPILNDDLVTIGTKTFDVTDRVSNFDLAGLVELELNYEFYKNLNIFSCITAKYSFTPLSNSDYFNDFKMRHKVYFISIGLKYSIKNK